MQQPCSARLCPRQMQCPVDSRVLGWPGALPPQSQSWWPCDSEGSSQEVPQSPQALPVSSRAGKSWQIHRALTCICPVSTVLTKGGKKHKVMDFFLLHFTPTFSAPCNLIFYTSFMCFYSAHLCVFFFFHTFGSALSPCLAPVIISFSFTMQTCRAAFNNREDLTDWSFDNGGGKSTITAFLTIYFAQKAFDNVTIW